MCCGVAAIVLSDSAAYLTGYQRIHLKTNKKHASTETGVRWRNWPALPAIFCDVIMSATSVGRSFLRARTPLEVPKERKK